jgi:hypothetical protein
LLKKKKRTLNKRNFKKKENLIAKIIMSLIPRKINHELTVEKKLEKMAPEKQIEELKKIS